MAARIFALSAQEFVGLGSDKLLSKSPAIITYSTECNMQ